MNRNNGNPPSDPATRSPFAARTGTRAPFSAAPEHARAKPPVAPAPAVATEPPAKGAGRLVALVAVIGLAGAGLWWWIGRGSGEGGGRPVAGEPLPVSATAQAPAVPVAPEAPAEKPAARAARWAKEFETLQKRASQLVLEDADRARLAGATLLAAQAQARGGAGEHEPAAEAWERAVAAAGPLVLGRLAALHEAEARDLRGAALADHAAAAPLALVRALKDADEAATRGAWSEAIARRDEARALIEPARRAVAAKFAEVAGGAAARGDMAMATLFHQRALRLDPGLEPSRAHLYRHKFAPGQILRSPGGLELAYAPPAEFVRGSASGEAGRDPDETPRRVVLTKGFFLAVRETTQADWDRVFGAGDAARVIAAAPARSRAIGSELPMHSVTWEQAAEYCRRLSALDGLACRLPTEAEWEYACRAGATTAFNLGVDGLSARDANIDDGTAGAVLAPRPPGASGRPNAWGLHDMHGNVWEWCADWSAPYPEAGDEPLRDPAGPAREDLGRIDLAMKVVRGGGWNASANDARSANRWEYAPAVATAYIGFRVAHDPDLAAP